MMTVTRLLNIRLLATVCDAESRSARHVSGLDCQQRCFRDLFGNVETATALESVFSQEENVHSKTSRISLLCWGSNSGLRSVISKEVNAHNSSFSDYCSHNSQPSVNLWKSNSKDSLLRFTQACKGSTIQTDAWRLWVVRTTMGEKCKGGGIVSPPGDGGNWRANSPPPPTRMPMQNPIFTDMHTTSHSPRTSLQAFCRLWLHMERVRVVCSTFRT